jgi:hypothetical protein
MAGNVALVVRCPEKNPSQYVSWFSQTDYASIVDRTHTWIQCYGPSASIAKTVNGSEGDITMKVQERRNGVEAFFSHRQFQRVSS